MKEKVLRLEQGLRLWESFCYMNRIWTQACQIRGLKTDIPLRGPVVHADEFRDYLLHGDLSQPFDNQRFLAASTGTVDYCGGQHHSLLPMAICSWTGQSRRVYHLSEDIQLLLSATSIADIHWSDVPWPFACFAITLDIPLTMKDSGNRYDAMIINKMPIVGSEAEVLFVHMFSVDLDKGLTVSRTERKAFARAMSKKRWATFDRLYRLKKDRFFDVPGSGFLINPKRPDAYIFRSISDLQDRLTSTGSHQYDDVDTSMFDEAAHLIVGLCLYLTTLKPNSPHLSDWRRPIAAGVDPSSVVRAADICTVHSQHKLSAEEKETIRDWRCGKSETALRCHFRRGHWRKEPGRGDDPNAPKIVMVSPTIVRKDRLPQGGIPGGSKGEVE